MSGPKVVRVVTREELLSRAIAQISALERTVERYAAFARRHDVSLSEEIASHRNVIAELKELTRTNAWNTIARRSVDATRIVEHDRKALEDNLIAAATKDRTVRRRLKDAARAIRRESRALNIAVPPELEDVVANVENATAAQLKRMDAAVAAASRSLVQHTMQTESVDSEMAKRLAAGLSEKSYTDWLANNSVDLEGQNSVRLDKILAELRLRDFAITEETAATIDRIQAAEDGERDLLINSLTIELGAALKTHRQHGEDLMRIEDKIARLEHVGSPEAQDLVRAVRESLSSDNIDNLPAWEQRIEHLLSASLAKANSLNQRKALLTGLTALGYEVREGMATALVENGRLVVKKPAEVEYGVEIVNGAADGRLQVRMVSFHAASNPVRDKDIEVIWCGEFSQLQAQLALSGHALNIEKAHAPGAVPMKLEQISTERDVDVEQARSRSV